MIPTENIMIDLETLGTERDSVILSFGAVKFDRSKVYEDDGLYAQLRWQEQLDNGGTVTEGTIRFWLGQHQAAREAILNKANLLHPHKALMMLNSWFHDSIKAPKNCAVWANGPSFDLSLLDDMYRRFGLGKPPWPYWAERCVRTAKMMAGVDAVSRPAEMTEHHAFHDAVYQAMQVRRFLVACGGPARRPTVTRTDDDLLS